MPSLPISARLRRLGVLVWKNCVFVRRRHLILTLLEIVLPVAFFAIAAYLRAKSASILGTSVVAEPKYFSIQDLPTLRPKLGEMELWYAPKNSFTDTLVRRARDAGGLQRTEGFVKVEEMLQQYTLASYKGKNSSLDAVACLIFEGEAAAALKDQWPKKLAYKIRIKGKFKTAHLRDPNSAGPNKIRNDPYFSTGFIGLQLIMNKAFIELAQSLEQQNAPANLQDQMVLQAMPYPPHVDDAAYSQAIRDLLPNLAMFSFFILCTSLTKHVADEKQSGVKELMKLMGMENWAYWAGWLIDAMLIRIVPIFVVVFLLTYSFNDVSGAVFDKSSFTLLVLIFFMYCASSIILLFSITSLFFRPIISISVACVVWSMSLFLPTQYVLKANPELSIKLLMMLFPNMGIYFAFGTALQHEKRGVGAQWNNVHLSATDDSMSDVSILHVLLMFAVDIVLFSIITWYFSAVNPGKFGHKKPPLFFAKKAYWLGESNFTKKIEDPTNVSQENYERPLTADMTDDKVGITIRNLRKTYPGAMGRPPVHAVRGVSLDIYKGEITALLGHNGAGKTTTMSILTGMISPSDGKVQVLGYDLKHGLTEIRQSLGLCPQHNLLFGELTVHQHLVFFAMLKGNSMRDAKREAQDLLTTVGLINKRGALVSELSGGMKRKLQLAIALIGGSQVVMLDEPTSGLDPEARREIWDLLLQFRKHRTIVLSTHFMEEADVLGDTIAIMSHGNVECCGSTMYLKRLFGAGYHLNLLRKHNCDEKTLRNTILNILPEVIVEHCSEDGTDAPKTGPITFTLPANKVDKFPELFDVLEKYKDELGIESIGVSVTTMEEVFLKVGELSSLKHANEKDDYGATDQEIPSSTQRLVDSNEIKLSGLNLVFQQVLALIFKKAIITKRNWRYLILQFFFPILMTWYAVFLSYSVLSNNSTPDEGLSININQYGSDKNLFVLYEFDDTEQARRLANVYADVLKNKSQAANVDNVEERLISIGIKSIEDYRRKYISAAKFATENLNLRITGLYNYDARHSAPVALDLISNALLKYRASPAYQISTENQPFPVEKIENHIIQYSSKSSVVALIWSSVVHFGYMFATAVNLILPQQERVLGARHLQVIASTPVYLVWLSYALVDITLTSILAILTIAVIYPFDTFRIFSSGIELGILFCIFFLYGIAGTMFAYFASFLKNDVSSAFDLLAYINLFFGGVVNFAIFLMEMFPNWESYGLVLRIIFGLLLPHSALISSLTHFSGTAIYNSVCRSIPVSAKASACQGNSHLLMCCERVCEKIDYCFKPASYMWGNKTMNYGNWVVRHGGIGQELIYLVFGIVLWSGIVLLIDSGSISSISEKIQHRLEHHLHSNIDDAINQDQDVVEETNKVNKYITEKGESNARDTPLLAVSSLSKKFGLPVLKHRFSAVRGISFLVNRGECFGLLGVNGAGKTTTFQMLTGSVPPTKGDAMLDRYCLSSDQNQFLSRLGYCPQFDAQHDLLTGHETLQLYARLRGVSKSLVDTVVRRWLVKIGLMKYANKLTASYSGGNRRKLSVAMALIGDPPIVLLDEPTSGVDPIARRQLWQALGERQQAGQSIVISSHSMDECEALCSRLAIMVAGKLVCLGPISHLKSKFGQGYSLVVKVKNASLANESESVKGTQILDLKFEIETKFSPCELVDEHQTFICYRIMGSDRKWSELFKAIESIKNSHSIMEDYTLSETTLEQVFLSFARQRDSTSQSTTKLSDDQRGCASGFSLSRRGHRKVNKASQKSSPQNVSNRVPVSFSF
ncbi:phospholipid-transporting ATPase ABCA1-like [Cloeon dipterum]|uniref:phospholipid-transporting ATPase ABCA1-like n=1 Tax=Cloeon dipterum TaxID=197152 RepID=UPI00321F93E9